MSRTVYKNNYDKMTQMPVQKLILSLSVPTTLSMLVTNIYNVADTYFVSGISTSASGATGVVFALMAIIQAFGFMLGHGAGSNISRKLGARQVEEARVYASTSLFLSFGCGIMIMTLGLIFCDPLMRLLGSTDTILPYAREYARFILIAAPAMAASCVMNNILRYEGKAFFAMIGLVSGGIINIFGDMLFIMKFGMGTAGAGLATAISQYISVMILIVPFLTGKTQSKFSIKYFSHKREVIKNIIFVGFPSMMRQGLQSISVMVLNLQAAVYGDAAIAAMSIASRVVNFLFCVGLGIGQGFQPVCAFNYGAGLYTRVKKGVTFALGFGTCFLGLFALVGLFNAEHIVAWFRDDPQVIAVGVLALQAQCASLFVVPMSVCGNMLFQSVGEGGKATFLASLRGGICFIPLVLILPAWIGVLGIQLSQPLADLISALITLPFIITFLRALPKDHLVDAVAEEK